MDAFAGTGYRSSRGDDPTLGRLPGFSKIDELVKGSARVAVEVNDRPFDEFVFIEKHATRYKGLTGLRKEFPEHADRMRFLNEDANAAIMTLCHETDWRRTRAVMFLDPCGMQVEWRTIEAIAETRSIDLWYLFPVGMGVVRMTPKSGAVPPEWQSRLDLTLGDPQWREVFYREEERRDLFGEVETVVEKTTDVGTVEKYLLDRLRSVFVGVAPSTWRLSNSRQCMYILAFAVGNERGKSVALKIASHLINEHGL